jgi:hypothetical protein
MLRRKVAEYSSVTTLRYVNSDWIPATVGLVVLLQLGAQTARGHADGGIESGIERGVTIKHFHANPILFQLIAFAAESVLDGVAEKPFQPLSRAEAIASENFFQPRPHFRFR